MRLCSFIPAPLQGLAIASILFAGIAVGAQNQDQDESKAAPPKPAAKAAPDADQDGKPDEAAPEKAPPAKTAPKTARDADPDQPAAPKDPAAPSKTAPRTNRDPAASAANRDPAAAANRAQPKAAQGERQATEQQRAALGAKIEAQGDQGLRVTTVEQNGIWAKSGLRQNDVIISAEGYTFNNPRQFDAWLWSQSGRQIPVIIDRGGQRYTIQVAMPQHGADLGWVGVNLDEGDADQKSDAVTKGARVTQVYPNGPASRSGLLPGDVITKINDQPIEGAADAVLQIRELQPQTKAMFAVLRDKEEMNLEIMVGSRATSGYQSSYGPPPNFQQGQFNPNDPRFAGQHQQGQQQYQGQQGGNMWQGVPQHAMQLEHHRRLAEQNERIETELIQLREEVKKLRELLEKK